jgi:hypothetical protein
LHSSEYQIAVGKQMLAIWFTLDGFIHKVAVHFPFPWSYKSVAQPAVAGLRTGRHVQAVTYKFEVNLHCTAGSTTRVKTEKTVGKFKLVWVVYVSMMVSVETAYVTYMAMYGTCMVYVVQKYSLNRQAVRSKCTTMEMVLGKRKVSHASHETSVYIFKKLSVLPEGTFLPRAIRP